VLLIAYVWYVSQNWHRPTARKENSVQARRPKRYGLFQSSFTQYRHQFVLCSRPCMGIGSVYPMGCMSIYDIGVFVVAKRQRTDGSGWFLMWKLSQKAATLYSMGPWPPTERETSPGSRWVLNLKDSWISLRHGLPLSSLWVFVVLQSWLGWPAQDGLMSSSHCPSQCNKTVEFRRSRRRCEWGIRRRGRERGEGEKGDWTVKGWDEIAGEGREKGRRNG